MMKFALIFVFLLTGGVYAKDSLSQPIIDIAGPIGEQQLMGNIVDDKLPLRREIIEAEVLPNGEVVEIRRYDYILEDNMAIERTPPGAPEDVQVDFAELDAAYTRDIDIPLRRELSTKARIGAEGRVDVNINSYPNKAVAKMTFKKGSSSFSCTAWRASKRVAVTNGHCVYDKASKKFHSSVRLDFGHRNGAFVQRENAVLLVVSKWYQQGKSGVDWGFVILKKNVANKTGWFGTKGYNKSWNNKNFWYVSQYASNMTAHAFNTSYQTRNKKAGLISKTPYSNRAVFHNVDTGQGASGSPIWSYWKVGNKYLPYAIAVNFGGWGPRNNFRMNSCSPFKWGKCGNVGTQQQVFVSSLVNFINKYP